MTASSSPFRGGGPVSFGTYGAVPTVLIVFDNGEPSVGKFDLLVQPFCEPVLAVGKGEANSSPRAGTGFVLLQGTRYSQVYPDPVLVPRSGYSLIQLISLLLLVYFSFFYSDSIV